MTGPVQFTEQDWDCTLRSEATCGESPMWSVDEQVLYWTDNVGRHVHRLDPASGDDVGFAVDEDVMDIVLCEGGRLLVVLAKSFAFFDPASGGLDRFAEAEDDRPDNRFNDGKLDRQGRYWAGSMDGVHWDKPSGALYRLGADLAPHLVLDDLVCSNGLGWSPDDTTFYLGESFRHAIFGYDFEAGSGSLSHKRLFAQVDKGGGAFPDGLTVDADGGVWSVHNGAGQVVRYAPDGAITHTATLPVPHPTSCMFGGPDLGTLFVTTARQGMDDQQLAQHPLSGSVFALRPGLIGLPEPTFGEAKGAR